jgi:hypothetical protein
MPKTAKGRKIHAAMVRQYGKAKGEKVFHASKNAGTIKGVDKMAKKKPSKSTGVKPLPSFMAAAKKRTGRSGGKVTPTPVKRTKGGGMRGRSKTMKASAPRRRGSRY